MTSNRAYLIRAIYEWLVDNGKTPHLLVDAGKEGVEVPRPHVKDGRIILNILSSAVRNLKLGNDWISFGTRFDGAPFQIILPPSAVLAIYARESGQGMAFHEEESQREPPDEPPPAASGGRGSSKPTLRVIK